MPSPMRRSASCSLTGTRFRCVLVEKPLGISSVVKHGRGYYRIDAVIAVQPRWPKEALQQ